MTSTIITAPIANTTSQIHHKQHLHYQMCSRFSSIAMCTAGIVRSARIIVSSSSLTSLSIAHVRPQRSHHHLHVSLHVSAAIAVTIAFTSGHVLSTSRLSSRSRLPRRHQSLLLVPAELPSVCSVGMQHGAKSGQ